MKKNFYILVVFILMAALFTAPAMAADSTQDREEQIKAAFLYNFINFINWPKEKMPDNNEPIIIGVIGNEDFIKAFEPIKGKQVRGKDIVIRYFDNILNVSENLKDRDESTQKQTIESLKKCHILFLCHSNSTSIENTAEIANALETPPVLIVGDQAGLIEKGCHINFLVKQKKIRFEINVDSAKKSGLEIRSKLLKLATRVIKKEPKRARID